MLNKLVFRPLASLLVPGWLRRRDLRIWHRRRGHELRYGLAGCATLADKVDRVLNEAVYVSTQKRTELLWLANKVELLCPQRLCEIGAFTGGTLALFASIAGSDAKVLSVDLQFDSQRVFGFPQFAGGGQSLCLIEGDTHNDITLAAVRKYLAGQQLDFLFIDGDHSYDGVVKDFEMYAPLVRPGGLIAFHDIHPDHFLQHGIRTGGDVGDVPRFWRELKVKGYSTEEKVEDLNQDGMGIGVVFWGGALL